MANEISPIERDLELRRYYRERVIYPGGVLKATQLLCVDESSEKLEDCSRTRAWHAKGGKVGIPVVHTNAGNAGCVIFLYPWKVFSQFL